MATGTTNCESLVLTLTERSSDDLSSRNTLLLAECSWANKALIRRSGIRLKKALVLCAETLKVLSTSTAPREGGIPGQGGRDRGAQTK